MRKKSKPAPRPLDRLALAGSKRLKGWTANKVAAIKAKREAAKGKTA